MEREAGAGDIKKKALTVEKLVFEVSLDWRAGMLRNQVSGWLFSRFTSMHKSRLKAISAVVWAFLSAARLGVSVLGRAVPGGTKPRHGIKRVDRLLSNGRWRPEEIAAVLAQEASRYLGALVVSLDWVELRSGFRALVASACTRRGRALPVAWKVVRPEKYTRSQNAVEDEFVAALAELLDVPRVCLVADRGFRRATFLELLGRLGFGYVIRVCGKVHVEGRGHLGLLENCGLKEGGEADLGAVYYREDGLVQTRLVWRWTRAQDEPWLLATNLAAKSLKQLCAIYALRMEEEETFRDLKSHRFGFALRYVLCSTVERYERMLAVWALGTWVLYAQGLAAVRAEQHYGLSTATNKHIDLSLVRIGHLLLRLALGSPQALFRQLAST